MSNWIHSVTIVYSSMCIQGNGVTRDYFSITTVYMSKHKDCNAIREEKKPELLPKAFKMYLVVERWNH